MPDLFNMSPDAPLRRAMLDRKFLPSGRVLFSEGTPFLHERRGTGSAVNSCAFVSTSTMRADDVASVVRPFLFLMEASLFGTGVGFDTLGAKKGVTVRAPCSRGATTFQVQDTREGWIECVHTILSAYLQPANLADLPHVDYRLIRPAGTPLQGFGGHCPGSRPLEVLVSRLVQRLDVATIHGPTTMDDVLIVDIMNMIGACIASGGIRRTAEIALGDPASSSFTRIKDYRDPEFAYRKTYGHVSNNSLMVDDTFDLASIQDMLLRTGEPGLVRMDLCRRYGRLVDAPQATSLHRTSFYRTTIGTKGTKGDKDPRAMGVNPCGEQTLEDGELCNLVEVFIDRVRSQEEFVQCARWAVLVGKIITMHETPWPDTNRIISKNRRIGCSISGIVPFIRTHDMSTLVRWIDTAYRSVRAFDVDVSAAMGINTSIKLTCVKPSGTISAVADSTPGLSPPFAPYYIRRVRVAQHDPIWKTYRDHGFPVEECVHDSTIMIVSFPSSAGSHADQPWSLQDQFDLLVTMQSYWADNNVSNTIHFDPNEISQLIDLYRQHRNAIKCASFCPTNAETIYPQMPFEKISRKDYESLIAMIRPVHDTDTRDAIPEFGCDTDSCAL
jgi:ribonucleoside-triphosphate reductase